MHQFFKKRLPKYESDTLIKDDKRMVRVFYKEGMSKNKRVKMGISF